MNIGTATLSVMTGKVMMGGMTKAGWVSDEQKTLMSKVARRDHMVWGEATASEGDHMSTAV
jgi:hypothetical protein